MSLPAAGILLAASSPESLGQPVQLVDVAGRPLLERVTRRLAEWTDPLIAVIGSEAELILDEVDFGDAVVLIDYEWGSGPGASLRAGLDYLARTRVHRPAFVTLGEQPGIDQSGFDALVAAHAGGVTVPVYRYEWGYPLLIDRSQWERFMSRELDPLDVARAHPEWVTEVRTDARMPRRIQVPADLAEVAARFGAA